MAHKRTHAPQQKKHAGCNASRDHLGCGSENRAQNPTTSKAAYVLMVDRRRCIEGTTAITYFGFAGTNVTKPSRFGIRTLGSVWAFIVSFSPMMPLSCRI
ncbi:hypothetical protein SAMN05192541_1763 [Bradyrhizobium arachidis]|nr:hypothetical protein SAMN05192541_1763 [Bradyrhizobium arachidis]